MSALFDYLSDGETLDSFLSDFEGVTREQAEGVIELGYGIGLRFSLHSSSRPHKLKHRTEHR